MFPAQTVSKRNCSLPEVLDLGYAICGCDVFLCVYKFECLFIVLK